MIYLDSAATSLHKPECVIEAAAEAMRTSGNAARGAHGASLEAAGTVYHARAKLASFFSCPRADHVVFTQNITAALNIAIYGLFSPSDHVITTAMEHNSVLRPLYDLQERGMGLDIIPADGTGIIRYEDIECRIHPNTKAVVCTHASNLTGNVNDIQRIAEIAHHHNLLLIIDSAQTAGSFPINMERMGIDVLCFTGHKGLLGPQGTGGLCVRPGVEIRPFLRGGSGVHSYDKHQPSAYPTRLEAGTLNSHGIAGLSAAIDFINETGIETLYQKEHERMMLFYEAVRNISGVCIYGDFSASRRAAIVTLNIRDYDSAVVADILYNDYGIAVRPGAHCAPLMHEALGTTEQGAVRFSFSPFNTEEDVLTAIKAVEELASE